MEDFEAMHKVVGNGEATGEESLHDPERQVDDEVSSPLPCSTSLSHSTLIDDAKNVVNAREKMAKYHLEAETPTKAFCAQVAAQKKRSDWHN